MKKALLLASTILFCLPAFAQESPQPFKGANVILLHTTDSSATAVKKLARLIVVNGLVLDKMDAEVGYLTTKGKDAASFLTIPATYEYKAVATPESGGTLLTITGSAVMRMSRTTTAVGSMGWSSGDSNHGKQSFLAIQKIASTYPAGRLSYTKQEQKTVLRPN